MKQSSVQVPSQTIGIDLSDETASFCAVDAAGEVRQEGSVPMTAEGLEEQFGDRESCRIVLEASTQSHWVARCLQELGHEVIVANPRQLHLISKSARKTDRNDARTLARIGRLDPKLLRPVYQRSERSLTVLALLRARKQLVWTRTRLITLIRAESKVHGHRLPTCSPEAFVKRVQEAIPTVLQSALNPILDELESLNGHIRHYDREIERLGRHEFPQTRVLRQVRGVGPLVALGYVATLDDPRRFPDSRQVGAYLGLTPRAYQSGQRDPNLRISKHGDRELRTLLVNAATHIMRRSSPDSDLKRHGKRIASRGNPRDRARARVAVARKLAVLLHRLWVTAEIYEPLRAASTAA